MHLGGGVSPQSCYDATTNSLRRAQEKELASIAFPAIGTGFGGLSMGQCATAMLTAVWDHSLGSVQRVIFMLFDESAKIIFEKTWHELTRERP